VPQHALKEWAVTIAALAAGDQVLIVRKGGIGEKRFELPHPRFYLFPTYLHQAANMLKPDERAGLEPHTAEPAQVRLSAAGVVTDIVRVESRTQIDALDSEHVWAPPLIDMRFNYRPDNPLYLLLVRAYRLQQPTAIDNTPAYAGCKSWVPLERPIPTGDALPVLDDVKYEFRRARILDEFGQ